MAIKQSINIVNRRAGFNFFISDEVEAGIQLTGTEVKAIREGKANLSDSFCYFKIEELWIKNLHISPYEHGSYANHEAKRERKLLLHRHQLTKLQSKLKEKGVTIIPISIQENERGLIKIRIGLARGKKLYDKRETLKKAEATREMGRVMKKFN
ncbi:MAG: SsrA-binding protein SmpB [Bacteroidota bacterium]